MKKNYKILISAFVAPLLFGLSGITAFAASPASVNLGTAGNLVILAKTGISTTGTTAIVGDIGLSPAAASYITGFSLTLPAGGAFSTSALVTGKIYAPVYANPTSANMATAVLDMQTAYTDAEGRAPNVTELGAGNIGGLTLAPGVYKWSTGVTIPTNITLAGQANDVWIFQIAQNLNVGAATNIILSGGAQANNIFWVVAGQTTIGTTAVFNGNILDQTTIVLNTGAKLNGRALAQAAVTLDSNSITIPSAVVSVSTQDSVSSNTSYSDEKKVFIPVSSTSTKTSAKTVIKSPVKKATAAVSPAASALGQQIKKIAINLGKGNRGNSTKILQQFLISQNKGPAAKALAKVGATAYFGALTRAALAEFQAKAGIKPALGNFGKITRSYLKTHY